jgi:hypothetical protein
VRQRVSSAEIVVFERDEDAFSRPQGYAIGLKYQAGLGVLGELGLREAVLAAGAGPVGRFVFTDQRGRSCCRWSPGLTRGA